MTNMEISEKLNELFCQAIDSLPKKKFTNWLCGFYGMAEVRAMKGMSVQENDVKRLEENLNQYKKEGINEFAKKSKA